MKTFPCALCLLVFASLPLAGQVQGQWTTTGSMQSAREFDAQVRIAGGTLLAAGGYDGSGNILGSAEVYSVKSGKWTFTGSMADAREAFRRL